jgi:hypothetical protein
MGGPRWLQTAFRWKFGSHLEGDNVDLEPVDPASLQMLPASVVEGFVTDVTADHTALKCGTMLLNLPKTHSSRMLDQGAAAQKVNGRREKAKQPALSRVIAIDVARPLVLPQRTGQKGTPKRPHDRRAHLRRLPNGTIKIIAAMRIKGGAAAQQTYKVNLDPPQPASPQT